MKNIILKNTLLAIMFSAILTSCHSGYKITNIKWEKTEITSLYAPYIDKDMRDFINSKKENLDKEMSPVIGILSGNLSSESRSFNPLANVVSDIVKEEAEKIYGKKIDMAVINIGGLRCDLTEGNITIGKAFELLPFMNTLCIMKMKGKDIKELFKQIASVGGEGISNGVLLTISKDGKLMDCSINGNPVETEKEYTVATIDYLAEGNDGMEAFKNGTDKIFPEDAILRDLFICHLQELTESGKKLIPNKDIRIIVK